MPTYDGYGPVLAALCMWREARGEPPNGQAGVYWAIANRVNDPAHRWPNNYVGVVLQKKQFSSFNFGDPNAVLFPSGTDPAYEQCCRIVDSPGADPTGGANSYHSYPDGDPRIPSWATPATFTVKIGAFSFYKL